MHDRQGDQIGFHVVASLEQEDIQQRNDTGDQRKNIVKRRLLDRIDHNVDGLYNHVEAHADPQNRDR